MHGRLKVRSTQEQEERRRVEREKKLQYYKHGMSECLKRVNQQIYDAVGFKLSEEILASNGDIQTLWNYRRNCLNAFHQQHLQQQQQQQQQQQLKGEEKEEKEEKDEVVMEQEAADDSTREAVKKAKKDSTTTMTIEEQMAEYFVGEMRLTEVCLKKNPKSYGSWHHRRWCLTNYSQNYPQTQSSSNKRAVELTWPHELMLCDKFLEADERNFHCWKHRYFVVESGQLSKQNELKFTHEKICSNFSNYSSWHYRSKLIEQQLLLQSNNDDAGGDDEQKSQIFANETELIVNALFTDPNDQSAWIYLRWLLLEYKRSFIRSIQFNASKSTTTHHLTFDFSTDSIVVDPSKDVKYLKLNNSNNVSDLIQWESISSTKWIGRLNESVNKNLMTNLSGNNEIKLSIFLDNPINMSELILTRINKSSSSSSSTSSESESEQVFFEYKSQFKNMHLNKKQSTEDLVEKLLQLSAIEAEQSKWCLLTLVELMALIDLEKYRATILDYLTRLANSLDVYRRHYYLDLKSKLCEAMHK